MKLILSFLLIICIYVCFVIFVLIKYKNIGFKDIDLNHNDFLSPSEIIYILNSDTRYKCYLNNEEYIYKKTIQGNKKYEKIILEIFSLKDGLPIKEIKIKEQ